MATTWETSAVRVERPPETSLADFFADMRSWLDHQCIIPAEFRGITLAGKSGVFDVLFDNPRDARLFGRRFAAHPAGSVPVRIDSHPQVNAGTPANYQSRTSILAAIAGDVRSVFSTRTKLHQSA
jgi:hypothetical protein